MGKKLVLHTEFLLALHNEFLLTLGDDFNELAKSKPRGPEEEETCLSVINASFFLGEKEKRKLNKRHKEFNKTEVVNMIACSMLR